jgi:toxin ParE1/3/4
MKPVRVRPLADTEIDAITDYIACDNPKAALRFLDALHKSFDQLSAHPGIGSRRNAHLPMLGGLRMWPISNFEKYLIFYIERPHYIDVLRILHSSRDLPDILLQGLENAP